MVKKMIKNVHKICKFTMIKEKNKQRSLFNSYTDTFTGPESQNYFYQIFSVTANFNEYKGSENSN